MTDVVSSNSLFNKRRGLLTEFETFTLEPSNTCGAASIPLNDNTTTIASLTDENQLSIEDDCDRVWLTCTVGWKAIANAPDGVRQGNSVDVLFKIFRGNRKHHRDLIFSCCQSANAEEENLQTTTFTHVDLPFAHKVHNPCEDDCQGAPKVTYFVTAELINGGQANVIGPITFTGAQIAQNPR